MNKNTRARYVKPCSFFTVNEEDVKTRLLIVVIVTSLRWGVTDWDYNFTTQQPPSLTGPSTTIILSSITTEVVEKFTVNSPAELLSLLQAQAGSRRTVKATGGVFLGALSTGRLLWAVENQYNVYTELGVSNVLHTDPHPSLPAH